MNGCFYFYIGREPSMSPLGRMEQGLEQREEGASRFRFILEEPIVL